MQGRKRGRLVVLAALLAVAVGRSAAEAQAPTAREGPDVLVISEPVLTAFERGLRTEIALRAEFRKELAALKTKQEYQRCYGESMTSPEAMKLGESILIMPDNITPGAQQRRTERAGRSILAFLERKCGPDPVAFGDSWRAKRLEEIERRAANAAGPLPSP